ncbi:hypothetical protein NQ318_021225, partial [Aromia moschata]
QDDKGWKMNHMIIILEPPSRKRTSVQYVSFWRMTVALHIKKLLEQWEGLSSMGSSTSHPQSKKCAF